MYGLSLDFRLPIYSF